MKNEILRRLNFCELLGYPKEFRPQPEYDEPLKCSSFCIECEKSGALDKAGGKLTLMSHGCDTADFETIFNASLPVSNPVEFPVLFLLEDPGGDYDLGEEMSFEGITKKPPINHYYWSPTSKSWLQTAQDVISNGNYYGTYFAYLMQRHSLKNVYITNLVKCKREGVKYPSLIEDVCVKRFLAREIKEFSPIVIFCFGVKVFNSMLARFPEQYCLRLYHPEFIRWRCYGKGLSPDGAIRENDRWIDEKLKNLNALPHHPRPPQPHR